MLKSEILIFQKFNAHIWIVIANFDLSQPAETTKYKSQRERGKKTKTV